jgi:hypothetical protein
MSGHPANPLIASVKITSCNLHCSATFSEPWSFTAAKFTRIEVPKTSSNQSEQTSVAKPAGYLAAQPANQRCFQSVTTMGCPALITVTYTECRPWWLVGLKLSVRSGPSPMSFW